MENILIVPKDSSAITFLMNLLKMLNVVKEVKMVKEDSVKKIIPPTKFKSQKHFFEGFGIFKSNPVNFKEIRKNAWKHKV